MIPVKTLLALDKKSETPVYLQIVNAFVQGVRRGHLRRGLRLPGSRELAAQLNIHRKTLQVAFDELMAQGWIEIIPRKGTFVVQQLPDIKPIKIQAAQNVRHYPEKTIFTIDEKNVTVFPRIDYQASKYLVINDGFPDIRLAPADILMRELRSIARRSTNKKYYAYGNAQGPAVALETLAAFFSDTRGLNITSRNILITTGAQMGIYLAARLLIKPGDVAVVGEPGYFSANLTLQHIGATVARVPVDEAGIDVDAIEALCKKKKIRLVYVIPHHHNPTTVTLSPERRIRLLQLAVKHKFAIIEDDYDYDFHYNSSPVLPMASLDHHGNVVYIGTLTKTLVPSIRIGFMIAPQNFIDAVSHLRRVVDWQGNTMIEVAVAELYGNGTISRHIKKSVKIYHERRDHFCGLLSEHLANKISFKVPDGGMSVWAQFNNTDLKAVASRAFEKGLVINDGRRYNVNATRMGFASLNHSEQQRAIEILKSCM